MKRIALFGLAIMIFALTRSSAAQQYAATANGCLREYYDASNYNWLTYENNCDQRLHIVLVARSGRNIGSFDLNAGGHDGPGLSSREVSAAGGIEAYACPAGYVPVDSNGNRVYARAVAQFRCKQD